MPATFAPLLGVNIDHVATLRQARGTTYPDIIQAAHAAEQGGADGITIHLREDRRHIQDQDVMLLRQAIATRLNLEMAATPEMVKFAQQVKPDYCCLVPEKRAELTTEGGLDVVSNEDLLKHACADLAAAGIAVSLFIDPDPQQIDAALRCQVPIIEIHTGRYADAHTEQMRQQELAKIQHAVALAHTAGLQVNAGHGLNYTNIAPIVAIPQLVELNIGHSIIAEAVFLGLTQAVSKMKQLLSL